jgi:hypothetical protein
VVLEQVLRVRGAGAGQRQVVAGLLAGGRGDDRDRRHGGDPRTDHEPVVAAAEAADAV